MFYPYIVIAIVLLKQFYENTLYPFMAFIKQCSYMHTYNISQDTFYVSYKMLSDTHPYVADVSQRVVSWLQIPTKIINEQLTFSEYSLDCQQLLRSFVWVSLQPLFTSGSRHRSRLLTSLSVCISSCLNGVQYKAPKL